MLSSMYFSTLLLLLWLAKVNQKRHITAPYCNAVEYTSANKLILFYIQILCADTDEAQNRKCDESQKHKNEQRERIEAARPERGWNCMISSTGVLLWPVAWSAGHRQGIYTRVLHINHVARLGDQTGIFTDCALCGSPPFYQGCWTVTQQNCPL